MKLKITPLTAIAVGLGALGLAQAGRLAFDATNAMAEGAAAPAEAAKAADAPAGEAAAPAGPPMCLPVDLAKEAGISAAEFRLLQSLQERRQTLDARERDIVTRENVLKTADQRVQERMAALKEVEGSIQRLLGQMDEAESRRIAQLVATYEKMKPKDAARVLEGLDDTILLAIAQRMKPQTMGMIFAQMSPERARQVTRMLAEIDEPDMSPLARAPAPGPPAPAAAPPAKAAAPPAKAPPPPAAVTPPAAAAATPPAGQRADAGPTAPRAPEAKGPTAPTAPQPGARPASGQAPADPPTKGG